MYYYHGPPNWVFPAFSFLGVVLSLIPLQWHLKARNVGTSMYMIYTALACLMYFVNAIVWRGNVVDWSPVWCDISTHYRNGYNLAIPATSLCINRRLYLIATIRRGGTPKTHAEKRREIITDLAISLGLPILQILLQYIVQGHRYDIFEDIGCSSATYLTPVSIALVSVPPILVGFVSGIYCIQSIYAFYKARAHFKEILSANSNLNLNTYLRLMILASVDLLCTIPIASWGISNDVSAGVSPWISWADTHSNFSYVGQYPGTIWRAHKSLAIALEEMRWISVACAFTFFVFFGFGEEAVKNYVIVYIVAASRIGYCGGLLPKFDKKKDTSFKFVKAKGVVGQIDNDVSSSQTAAGDISVPTKAAAKIV